MTEALASGPLKRVLEIGTGSGYQAAILSQLAGDVYTVERIESLYHHATEVLEALGYHNVHTRFGDGTQGWAVHAPYDGIMVTAAVDVVPEDLLRQLADGGRMICPVGPYGSQVLQMITRHGSQFHMLSMDPVRFVPFVEGTE
jgi:protein-L-isoaspartate(D-aspartate) O-methyltransferase